MRGAPAPPPPIGRSPTGPTREQGNAGVPAAAGGAVTIRVVLKPLRCRIPGGLPAWAVMLDGRTIIPRAHDPAHEAARWLRDHGYTGPMETAREDGTVCMRYARPGRDGRVVDLGSRSGRI